MEAMLAAIGSQADEILEYIDDEVDMGNPKPTDVETLLVNVIPNLLGLSGKIAQPIQRTIEDTTHGGVDCPFLQGRAFVFASQYTKVLPEQLAGQYLHATVQVLEAGEANIPIKVSAVKAIHKYVYAQAAHSTLPHTRTASVRALMTPCSYLSYRASQRLLDLS